MLGRQILLLLWVNLDCNVIHLHEFLLLEMSRFGYVPIFVSFLFL